MDISATNLTGHFLIAMPSLKDPGFARTLTFIAEHNEQGALGIIINRPLEMTLANLFERVDLPLESEQLSSQPVYFGGPIQTERGFVLHRSSATAWHSTLNIDDIFGLTSSRDILLAMSRDSEPCDVIVSLGYAGWAAGQLEHELSQNAWLTTPADASIIFDLPPAERLAAAMRQLGVDFANLNNVAGHA